MRLQLKLRPARRDSLLAAGVSAYYRAMRRVIIASVLIIGLATAVVAQVDRLETFQSSFASSNLQTKLEILRAAASEDAAAFGPLYGQALSFVVSNAEDLTSEQLLREIALVAINRIDEAAYTDAVNDLWRLFRLYNETTARIEIAGVLGRLATDSPQTIGYINQWVQTRNNLTRAGTDVDLQVLSAVLQAQGNLGASSSFPSVVDAILVGYPDFVVDDARTALSRLDGVQLEMASAYVLDQDIQDRYEPFAFFVSGDYLSEPDSWELSRVVLSDTLRRRPQELGIQEEARRIRFFAADVIRNASYSEATSEAIRHFNETVLEFERGRIVRSRLLEAIATLGAMGTDQAAARLTEYLELLNTYTEIDRPYDTQIVLATIQNLQILDRPASYNALFTTSILENYPTRVTEAAREAMRAVAQ